jgi:hypothetical protein
MVAIGDFLMPSDPLQLWEISVDATFTGSVTTTSLYVLGGPVSTDTVWSFYGTAQGGSVAFSVGAIDTWW